MRYCRVVGPMWAAVKHPAFVGRTLLVVQPLDERGHDAGSSFVAVDHAQAGTGDKVLVLTEGNGVRQILKETIEPELQSDHARSRLQELRAVLAQVDWDDAAYVLAERNRALLDALQRISQWREDDPARAARVPEFELPTRVEGRLAQHQVNYEALAALAVSLVDPLTDWVRANPGDESGTSVRDALIKAV